MGKNPELNFETVRVHFFLPKKGHEDRASRVNVTAKILTYDSLFVNLIGLVVQIFRYIPV